MVIIMRRGATAAQIDGVVATIDELGLKAHLSRGEEVTIIGVVVSDVPSRDHYYSAYSSHADDKHGDSVPAGLNGAAAEAAEPAERAAS